VQFLSDGISKRVGGDGGRSDKQNAQRHGLFCWPLSYPGRENWCAVEESE
jgi:hypothetical protein